MSSVNGKHCGCQLAKGGLSMCHYIDHSQCEVDSLRAQNADLEKRIEALEWQQHDYDEAKRYLTAMLLHFYPNIKLLNDLTGLAMQLDSATVKMELAKIHGGASK